MMKKLRVNVVSESEVSIQGHGVHTAYEEMVHMLQSRTDVEVITGRFGEQVDCDIVHIHTVGPRTFKKLFQKNVKKVISAHVVPDSFVGSLLFARAWRPLAYLYLKWFYSKADLLLAVSDETARELRKMNIKVPIEVLHNSIDTSNYKIPSTPRLVMRKELGISENQFVVIGAGQVQPRKRIKDFISVAKKLPDVSFVWIGGMPFGRIAADNAAMTRMIKTAPKNVIFQGIVPLKDMSSYYHAADMFWLPSEQETFGLVVVEAAASGLPIMLRDIPDYAETFAGDALQANSIDQYCSLIQTLKNNPTEYKKWRMSAKRIAERFDSKAAADQLLRLYRDLL